MLIRIYKMAGLAIALGSFILPNITGGIAHAGNTGASEGTGMIDVQATEARLRDHLKALTVDIGERSVLAPGNLKRAAGYIRDFYRGIGIGVLLEGDERVFVSPADPAGFVAAAIEAGGRAVTTSGGR